VQQVGVDVDDLAHMTEVDDFRLGHFWRLTGHDHFFGANQRRVLTGQADGAATVAVDQVDDFLVHMAAQHHFHHIHGLRVGHAHAVDKMALDGQTLEQIADLRAATVDYDRVDTHGLHQHDVTGKAGFQVIVLHSVAAVLDHQRLADVTANVGQRFGQNLGDVGGGITFEGHSGLR